MVEKGNADNALAAVFGASDARAAGKLGPDSAFMTGCTPHMSRDHDRLTSYLLAARQSPNFGLRWLALSPEARAETLRRWYLTPPQSAGTALAELRRKTLAARAMGLVPGVRKSAADRVGGIGAQLEAFARSIRRVG